MTRRRARHSRIASVLAAKAVTALALALPTSLRRPTVEYRALSSLPGLEPGAPVTLAGQLIGEVISTDRRGDTTVLRVRFVRGAERLPGGRGVRLRRLGYAPDVMALEIRIESRSERPRHERSFALGGWLEVLPSDPAERLFMDARQRRQLAPPAPPPAILLLPLAPPGPRPAPTART